MPARGTHRALTRVWVLAVVVTLTTPAVAVAHLSTRNNTPFPSSALIVNAGWISRRYGPPPNQFGDILPTIWADNGYQYAMIDDGATNGPASGAFWKQSLARIQGFPPSIKFAHVGNPNSPPPATFAQIHANHSAWEGPLGPYYSSGLVEANNVFYATQEYDWNWNANAKFQGLEGIAYSLDHGKHWNSVNDHFPAPLGNLSWVIRGRGGFYADGWVYAIATEREFNASTMIMGRARPHIADITNPANWQWLSGWTSRNGQAWPVFSSSFSSATPIISWKNHITYPQMAYDAPINRYLLTFTYSYSNKIPGVWKDGADFVLLESPHPWGPFSFVAHESMFGPSNGYSPGVPIRWISDHGQEVWVKWAANFAGCEKGLNCAGGYGFNYAHMRLTLANSKTGGQGVG